MSISQDFSTQQSQSPSKSPSPRRPRQPEPFLSLQILETAAAQSDIPKFATCCLLLPAKDGSLTLWFISASNVYHLSFSADQAASKAKALKIPADDLMAIVRDSFETKGVKHNKKGSKIELSFSGRNASGTISTMKLDLERHLQDPVITTLLQNFGGTYERQQVENQELVWKVEELKSQPGTGGGTTSSFSATDHRPAKNKFKKPKIDPHMSVINPRSRAIKSPKGVVFEEEEDES